METFITTSGHLESYTNGKLDNFKTIESVYDGEYAVAEIRDNDKKYYAVLDNKAINDIHRNIINIFDLPVDKQSLELRLMKQFIKAKEAKEAKEAREAKRPTTKRATRKNVESINRTIY